MNKSFILTNKNNEQKVALEIVKFNFDGIDYLVYSIDENEQNSQIFVSQLILNSEGKYFIDNILPEEKNKLSNIVYNIVILTPTEAQKGISFDVLSKNLLDKFSVKLHSNLPILENQEYHNSSSIALTNKILVNNAIKFYEDNLNKEEKETINELPTWTAPMEVTAPTPISISDNTSSLDTVVSIEPSEIVKIDENKLQPVVQINEPLVNTYQDNISNNMLSSTIDTNLSQETVLPNPQAQKLAIISDPSLGFGISDNNLLKEKAGFANTKYIVIGTVCLVLAVAVVIAAYVLISNMN
jgi:hypothetical protein